jgi:RNA polymerase sigma-70 factor (ECF subfamily)
VNRSNQNQENEALIITRAQKGDRDAFGELVMIHHTAVYTMVYRLTGDSHLAEDATQQAFIKAWQHLPSYRPTASLRAWLGRIAINTSLDTLRHDKRILPDDEMIDDREDPQPGPESQIIDKQRAAAIQNALLSLNETNRSVLVLREYSGMSYQEIANVLEIPLGTVMSRLNNARTQLRTILQPIIEEIEVEYG